MKKLQKYNTNLASEYYVLSMLYRLGVDAYLTLEHKIGSATVKKVLCPIYGLYK